MRFAKTDISRLIAEALGRHKARSPIEHPDGSVKARHLADDVPEVGAVNIQDDGAAKGTAATLNVATAIEASVAGSLATISHKQVSSGDLHTEYVRKSLLTARGDMIRRGASAPERFAKGTAGKILKMGADDPDWQWDEGAIEYVIDGGGEAIATGLAGGLEVPFDCYIDSWTITATDGLSGAIVVDVWVDTYANFPPTVADTVCASMKPTITATGNKGQNTNPTGWSSGKARLWAKGDWVFFNVDSVASLTCVTLSLKVSKYRTG